MVHEDRSEQSDVIQHNISGLAAAITKSMAFARIPIAKPPVFNGDPLEYHSWKVSFDMMVSQKNITPREKILFLKEYTGSSIHKIISSLDRLTSEDSFQSIMKRIEERYGEDVYICDSYRKKLKEFPNIGHTNHKLLRDYSDLLSQIQLAHECLPGLKILDDSYEILNMARKLPESIRRTWATRLRSTLTLHRRQPYFKEFLSFVNDISDTYNDSIIKKLFEKTDEGDCKKKCLSTSSRNCSFCQKTGHSIHICRVFENLQRRTTLSKKRKIMLWMPFFWPYVQQMHEQKQM